MTPSLWRFDAAVAAAGGEASVSGVPDLTGVSIDSRTITPGALFVAIRGERLDGHDYVGAAFAAGAGAAIVAKDWDRPDTVGPLIRVDDTLEALNGLGGAARARSRAKVIAVTGSVGKTGSKEALRLALAPSGSVHASEKSFNNQWGVPLSLSLLPEDTQFCVSEIGMNHAGEIVPLTKMVRPHVAIVTTVAPVHLEFFASVEDIAEAKAEIFQGLEPGGTAILNRDNTYFDLLSRRARECGAGSVIGFGRHADADVRLIEEKLGIDGSEVSADIRGESLTYRLGAPGAHIVSNSLAVLAAIQAVGANLRDGAAALENLAAPKGRGERITLGRTLVIDESYNANPASMRAALDGLGKTPRSDHARRVAVLGDMLELGEEGANLHRDLAQAVDAADVDVVFACGPQMASLFEALPDGRRGAWRETSEELEKDLLADVREGDAVMIKGSLGSRMGPLVEALRTRMEGADS